MPIADKDSRPRFSSQLAKTCEIIPTELEDNAGLLGAALLAQAALPALQTA